MDSNTAAFLGAGAELGLMDALRLERGEEALPRSVDAPITVKR